MFFNTLDDNQFSYVSPGSSPLGKYHIFQTSDGVQFPIWEKDLSKYLATLLGKTIPQCKPLTSIKEEEVWIQNNYPGAKILKQRLEEENGKFVDVLEFEFEGEVLEACFSLGETSFGKSLGLN